MWKNADNIQKSIIIIGGILMCALVVFYVPKFRQSTGNDDVVELDSVALSTTDLPLNQLRNQL